MTFHSILQYKSIAQVNEAALKEMETVHENFRTRVILALWALKNVFQRLFN